MIYVDQYPEWICGKDTKWYKGGHLFGTDLDELHKFAKSIGLRREWYQGKGFPHYDLTASKRALAIQGGATHLEPGMIPDDVIRHDPSFQ